MKTIRLINDETIEIARYENPKSTYDINNTNDDICIFKEIINPFELYEENQRLNNIINKLEKDLEHEIKRTEELMLEESFLIEITHIRKATNEVRNSILYEIKRLKENK